MDNQRTVLSNKEVRPYGLAKKENCIIVKSKKGNVSYLVMKPNDNILENIAYKEIFEVLNSIESKLEKPLDFPVHLDYITLNSFKESFTCEELQTLKDTIGTKIFYFINDLSHKKNIYDTKYVSDNYLYNDKLKNLKEFYTNHKNLVEDCFARGYSSLPLFDAIYNNDKVNSTIKEIYDVLNDELLSDEKRQLTYGLIIYVENVLPFIQSEKAKEDFYFMIRQINNNYNKILESDICNESNLTIESLYDIVKSNSQL